MYFIYPGCSHSGLTDRGNNSDGLAFCRHHHEPRACGAFKELRVKAGEIANLCLGGDQYGIEPRTMHKTLDDRGSLFKLR